MNFQSEDLYNFLDELKSEQGHAAAEAAAKRHAGAGRTHAKRWLDEHAVAKGAVSIQKIIRNPTEEQALNAIAKGLDESDAKMRELGYFDTPYEKLEKGLRAYCEREKIASVWTEGLAKFQATDEGAILKSAYHDDPRPPARRAPAPELAATSKREDATANLEAELLAFCKANKIDKPWTIGLEKFRATPAGRALADAANAAIEEG